MFSLPALCLSSLFAIGCREGEETLEDQGTVSLPGRLAWAFGRVWEAWERRLGPPGEVGLAEPACWWRSCDGIGFVFWQREICFRPADRGSPGSACVLACGRDCV